MLDLTWRLRVTRRSNDSMSVRRFRRRSGLSPMVAVLLVVTGAVFGGAAPARAADAVAAARATILAPVAVTGEAVRLTMEPGGGRDCRVDATCAGPIRAAAVQVSGAGASGYSLTLPGKATIFSGSDSLTLDQFTALLGAAGSSGKIDARTVEIGANLHLPADQPTGDYSGSFEVIFEYE